MVVVVVVARHGSGMRQQIVRDLVRRRQAGKTRLALLDFANAQISRVANLGTSCRVRVPLSSCFFSLSVPLEYSFVSLSLFLFRSPVSSWLALTYVVTLVPLLVAPVYLPPSSSTLPGVDRPSLSVPIREQSRIPPAAISVSVTYTSHRHSCSSSRSRRTYDAAAGRPRNAEGIRVRSKASAATRALDPPPPPPSSSREYHLPDAADAR